MSLYISSWAQPRLTIRIVYAQLPIFAMLSKPLVCKLSAHVLRFMGKLLNDWQHSLLHPLVNCQEQ